MIAFILAIFISAFLLFQVQPIIARFILPWYGGSPAVWTTCMLFFQVGLLAGYTYAHLLVSRCRERPRLQIGIHLGLLALSFLLLPIIPADSLKPDGSGSGPALGILLLLLQTVGLPFVVISATGPLLQNWFSETHPGKSPYRLYAVSNFGSLLGLLSYPFIVEPRLTLGHQAWMWSGGYLAAAIIVGFCGWRFSTRSARDVDPRTAECGNDTEQRPTTKHRLLWIAFSACGSTLLLAITNQMCQDVAVVPFLWVLPLSLYLITFIISFDHARWYWRPLWIPLALVGMGLLITILNLEHTSTEWHLTTQIGIYSLTLFACCMICHGEMVRLKPTPRHLTSFYLAISLGGALGGLFVNVAAPRLFLGFWELHAGLIFFVALISLTLFRQLWGASSRRLVGAICVLWIQFILAMLFFLHAHIKENEETAIAMRRGFYGVLRVYENYADTEDHGRSLNHGRICHGSQYLHEDYRDLVGSYYGEDSGVGILFRYFPARFLERPMNIGVVGLGVGTIAGKTIAGDKIRFYEINPQVSELAHAYFTYLEDSKGDVSIVLGDARITLEEELTQGHNQDFDALFVDAFSGDSIPLHLLTREAFELYFSHIARQGVLVIHITNMHLDLSGPIRAIAREMDKGTLQIEYYTEDGAENYSCWVLVTENADLIESIEWGDWGTAWETDIPEDMLWTDDYCNLFRVIEWEEEEEEEE
jgi:hypothetical protein